MKHTHALAQQQRDFLIAIFATDNIAIKSINTLATAKNTPKSRGILVYQANATASAVRSLHAAYPVISQLIGADAFEHLAHDFWEQHPPTRGDLAQWGEALAGFISSLSAMQTEPYLSDIAHAEWALHTAATEADQTAEFASFALLTTRDPDTLTLQLAAGTALIRSNFPIASMLWAHLETHLDDSPSFERVGLMLRQNMAEIALVWRQGLQPRVTRCAANEAAFIERLLAGQSLLKAFEGALEATLDAETPFDFSHWLSQAVQDGLLLGAELL